jgi:toxin CcdB
VAQFDLYRPKGAAGPLLDIQSPLLEFLRTRVVVPLLPPAEIPAAIRNLHPVLLVDGTEYVLVTQLMGAIRKRELGPPVGNLEAQRTEIIRALDTLLSGV